MCQFAAWCFCCFVFVVRVPFARGALFVLHVGIIVFYLCLLAAACVGMVFGFGCLRVFSFGGVVILWLVDLVLRSVLGASVWYWLLVALWTWFLATLLLLFDLVAFGCLVVFASGIGC